MSRASVQSLTILAVVSGALITMEEEGIAGEHLPAVLWAREQSQQCINGWPETGSPLQNTRACFAHCEALRDRLEESRQLYTSLCLTSLALLLLTDLAERVRCPVKQGLIEPLAEAITGLHDLIDPAGERYEVYEEAERLARLVKLEIGF